MMPMNNTLLMMATEAGNQENIEFLINKGADPRTHRGQSMGRTGDCLSPRPPRDRFFSFLKTGQTSMIMKTVVLSLSFLPHKKEELILSSSFWTEEPKSTSSQSRMIVRPLQLARQVMLMLSNFSLIMELISQSWIGSPTGISCRLLAITVTLK